MKSFIDYFSVPKGNSDIRMVLNGTSCGLNQVCWSSNFWLPNPDTLMRSLSYNYKVVDIDIGEMFLNFPLHSTIHKYSGMDLTQFKRQLIQMFPEIEIDNSNNKVCALWERLWFGFRQSPECACYLYYIAEEFI